MGSFKQMKDGVLTAFDITDEQLTGPCREARYVMARTVLVGLARKHTRLSYPALSLLMNRDTSTLITAARRCDALAQSEDPRRVFSLDKFKEIEATL